MLSPSRQTIVPLARYINRFSLAAVSILLGILTLTYGAAIQEQERIVTKLETSKDPVKVTVVKTKKGAVEIDKEFAGDDDWFKGLAVRLKNTSGKSIIYISVELFFPREKSSILADSRGTIQALPYANSIGYGWRINVADTPPVGFKPVAPGEHVDIELSERQYLEIKTALAQTGFPSSIKKITVRPEVVYFEDGVVWYSGTWYRRDPNNPKKLYLIDPANPQKLIPIEPPPSTGGTPSPAVFLS